MSNNRFSSLYSLLMTNKHVELIINQQTNKLLEKQVFLCKRKTITNSFD